MRKFLITMMCVIMVVCFMPTVAMAEGSDATVGSYEELISAIESGKTNITLKGNIEINDSTTIKNVIITTSGTYSIIVKNELSLNNVTINANMTAGYAPITITTDGAKLFGHKLTVTCTGTSASGYYASQQAIQVDKTQRGATESPSDVIISLTDSALNLDGVGARGICFAGDAPNTTVTIDNTKINNGANCYSEWKGGQSRGIALFNASTITVNVLNGSEVCGWQYAINSGRAMDTAGLKIIVDNSRLSGWTGFNIWTDAGTIEVRNNSLIEGINGAFNSDKIYSFSAVVINDDIYNNGWGTATKNTIIIEDSTIVAKTTDNQPTEQLIRIDSPDKNKLEIKGSTSLQMIADAAKHDIPFAINNSAMENRTERETFIRENIFIDPTVMTEGLKAFITSGKNVYNPENPNDYWGFEDEQLYCLPVLSTEDATKGTVSINRKLYYGGETMSVEAIAKSGYEFEGWYHEDVKLEGNATSVTLPAEINTCNFEIVAKWKYIGGTYIPTTPPTTQTDNVTNSGSAAADNATTSADLSNTTSTSNGTTTATVDKTTADKIVDKAVENKSTEVVIDATANTTTAANSTTVAQVTIPTETLGAIAEKTEADVTIKTDVAEVKMDNAAAAAVSEQATGDTVQIVAEKVAEETDKVEFELKVVCSDGKVISNFNGGNIAVTVALPKAMAEKKVVCVYIDDNGHMSKVEGQKNADGTYTFFTGHFSTYAILAEEEADAAIAEQTEAIKNIEIKVSTKLDATKAGKKGIKVTWKTADGKKLDGVEFFRSVKKNSGYGKKAFFTSKKAGTTGYYLNTKSLKKGTRYYYRVRGYVLVDGQKVYTDWSNKGIRTFR